MYLPHKRKFSFGWLDLAALSLLISAAALFLYRTGAVLDYDWQWEKIPGYLVHRAPDTGNLIPNMLLNGFFSTVRLSLWSTLLAFAIGTFFGVLRARGAHGQRLIARLYVETIRNIPSLVLVFIFYFFVSSQIFDATGIDALLRNSPGPVQSLLGFLFTSPPNCTAFFSAIITLGIYEGAYVAEIVRGGLAGIPKSQWEASQALGMTRIQTLRFVILPQAIRNVLSPLAGQFISTIKDSAIVSVISIQELTFQGMEIMTATYLTFEIWLTVTALYFLLTFPLSRFVARLEKIAIQY